MQDPTDVDNDLVSENESDGDEEYRFFKKPFRYIS